MKILVEMYRGADYASYEEAEKDGAIYSRTLDNDDQVAAFILGANCADLCICHSMAQLQFKTTSIEGVPDYISIIWSIEDVKDMRSDLSDEQASKVLQHIKQGHDCNYGITWETLEAATNALYPAKEA